MVLFTSVFPILAAGVTVLASPPAPVSGRSDQLTARQREEIPEGMLYWIEWWPEGCGIGDYSPLSGHENKLEACVNVDDILDPDEPAGDSAIRFLFPEEEDDRTFKWRAFGTQDCSEQIAGSEDGKSGCFTVPNSQKIGAVIVYT